MSIYLHAHACMYIHIYTYPVVYVLNSSPGPDIPAGHDNGSLLLVGYLFVALQVSLRISAFWDLTHAIGDIFSIEAAMRPGLQNSCLDPKSMQHTSPNPQKVAAKKASMLHYVTYSFILHTVGVQGLLYSRDHSRRAGHKGWVGRPHGTHHTFLDRQQETSVFEDLFKALGFTSNLLQ